MLASWSHIVGDGSVQTFEFVVGDRIELRVRQRSGSEVRVRFLDVEAFRFVNGTRDSILMDICVISAEEFVAYHAESLPDRNFEWPFHATGLDVLRAELENRAMSVFVIESTLGMDGWVVARRGTVHDADGTVLAEHPAL